MYGNVAHPARHPIYIAWFYKSIFGHQDGPRPLVSQAAEEELAPNEASFREARCSNGTFHLGMARKPSKTFGSFQPSDGLPLKSRSVMVYEVGI